MRRKRVECAAVAVSAALLALLAIGIIHKSTSRVEADTATGPTLRIISSSAQAIAESAAKQHHRMSLAAEFGALHAALVTDDVKAGDSLNEVVTRYPGARLESHGSLTIAWYPTESITDILIAKDDRIVHAEAKFVGDWESIGFFGTMTAEDEAQWRHIHQAARQRALAKVAALCAVAGCSATHELLVDYLVGLP